MSSLPLLERYTVRDYLQWEGDWELIDGQALAMVPSPSITHQRVCGDIYRLLAAALEGCPACEVLYEIDVELNEETVVRPDVVAICYEPEGERLTRAPELAFEVVSPHSSRRDEVIKLALYRREGVRYYVIVYPAPGKAKIYRLVEGEYRLERELHDGEYRFDLSRCSFDLDFGAVWTRRRG